MTNRQERRRLKRSGLQPHTPEIEIPKQLQEKTPIWRYLFSIWWKIFLVVGTIIGFVGGVLAFRTVLDVSTSFQSDQNNPYSEIFAVKNDGLLPLYNLKLTCVQEWFKDSSGNSGTMNTTVNQSAFVTTLGSGDKTSILCNPAVTTSSKLIEASISLKIQYQTFLPKYTSEKSFHFLGVLAKDGQMHWTPKS